MILLENWKQYNKINHNLIFFISFLWIVFDKCSLIKILIQFIFMKFYYISTKHADYVVEKSRNRKYVTKNIQQMQYHCALHIILFNLRHQKINMKCHMFPKY